MWTLKHIDAVRDNSTGTRDRQDGHLTRLHDKKWYFLAHDALWVNVPAVLDLARRFDPGCPALFGYVWSDVWLEVSDYVSGSAGMLLSQKAFQLLAPALKTGKCSDSHYRDIELAKCLWEQRLQLVHHTGFSFDPPPQSKVILIIIAEP